MMIDTLSCLDSETVSFCQKFQPILAKTLIDAINSLDVAQNHVGCQRTHTDFLSRFMDMLTGQGLRRQNEINSSVVNNLETLWGMVEEHSKGQFFLAEASRVLSKRVEELEGDVALVARCSGETIKELKRLSEFANDKFIAIENEIKRIDYLQQAHIQLDAMKTKWKMNYLGQFSPAVQACVMMEELCWGAFGTALVGNFGNTDDLQVIAIGIIGEMLESYAKKIDDDYPAWDDWLKCEDIKPALFVMSFLADWANEETEPIIYSIANPYRKPSFQVPVIIKPQRLAQRLVRERTARYVK